MSKQHTLTGPHEHPDNIDLVTWTCTCEGWSCVADATKKPPAAVVEGHDHHVTLADK